MCVVGDGREDARRLHEQLTSELNAAQDDMRRLRQAIDQMAREYEAAKDVDVFRRYGMLKRAIKRTVMHLRLHQNNSDDFTVATPGKTYHRVATPGKIHHTVATPAKTYQTVATPGKTRQSVATPGKTHQTVANLGKTRQTVATPGKTRTMDEQRKRIDHINSMSMIHVAFNA